MSMLVSDSLLLWLLVRDLSFSSHPFFMHQHHQQSVTLTCVAFTECGFVFAHIYKECLFISINEVLLKQSRALCLYLGGSERLRTNSSKLFRKRKVIGLSLTKKRRQLITHRVINEILVLTARDRSHINHVMMKRETPITVLSSLHTHTHTHTHTHYCKNLHKLSVISEVKWVFVLWLFFFGIVCVCVCVQTSVYRHVFLCTQWHGLSL